MANRTVYIGVHPYGSGGCYEDQPGFVRARDARLRDASLSQLLLIEESSLDETIENLELDMTYWNGRIFLTQYAIPTSRGVPVLNEEEIERRRSLIKMSPNWAQLAFEDLSALIRKNFPAEEYRIWGAELHVDKKGKITKGCVSIAFTQLDLPNKTIERTCCYVCK